MTLKCNADVYVCIYIHLTTYHFLEDDCHTAGPFFKSKILRGKKRKVTQRESALWSPGLIMKRDGDETGWVMEEGYEQSGREREV